MNRKLSLVLLALWLSPALAHAAITTSLDSTPTLGLPGFSTWTMTATAAADEKIVGFDFVGNGSNYGFFGAMNQVNPLGQSTVFQDSNPFFQTAGFNPLQDSQFNVLSSKGILINATESAESLKAAFNYSPLSIANDASSIWSFAQIVLPDALSVNYQGTLTIQDSSGHERLEFIRGGDPALLPPAPAPIIYDPPPVEAPPTFSTRYPVTQPAQPPIVVPTPAEPPIETPATPPTDDPTNVPIVIDPQWELGSPGWSVIVGAPINSGEYLYDPIDVVQPTTFPAEGGPVHRGGLQWAMTVALTGLQAAETSIDLAGADGASSVMSFYFNASSVDHDGTSTNVYAMAQSMLATPVGSNATRDATPTPEPGGLFLAIAAQLSLPLFARRRR